MPRQPQLAAATGARLKLESPLAPYHELYVTVLRLALCRLISHEEGVPSFQEPELALSSFQKAGNKEGLGAAMLL